MYNLPDGRNDQNINIDIEDEPQPIKEALLRCAHAGLSIGSPTNGNPRLDYNGPDRPIHYSSSGFSGELEDVAELIAEKFEEAGVEVRARECDRGWGRCGIDIEDW